MSGPGRVVLVGAGPGAPDLVTVRGERALREADVVVYDALAPEALLELAPAGAERIDVGKRGHDAPTRTQEDINALLVDRARAGLRVVRLKGGDPFVFGRGGEEVTACVEAGVPVDVVPGVSAALAAPAAAGIPLTDRRFAASFAVVTGHKDPSRPRENIDWACLARAVDTLVILMGMRNLGDITARLLEAGRAPDTPAAVVVSGTTTHQRVLEAPLGELARRVAEEGLGAPAAVVVGDVVRLRAALAGGQPLPLAGRRVLVTRTAAQAEPWVAALRAAGADAVVRPLIRIEPVRASAEIDAALAALDETDVLLLTSANGARELAARARERGVALAAALGGRVWCVGPATARAAREAGLAVHALPRAHDAEALLAAVLAEGPVSGRRFLIPGAAAGRPVLADGLRAAGARVRRVALYHTVPAEVDAEALRGALVRGELDALTFASPSAVRAFDALLDPEARAAACRILIAAIGPVTADALREAGMEAHVMAAEATADALVEALAAGFRKRAAERTKGATP